MAEGPGRIAICCMRAECRYRRRLCWFNAIFTQGPATRISAVKISIQAFDAPCKKIGMAVTFHIPGALREFTAGRSRVEVEQSPATLADALAVLWTLYPGVRDRIATEQGAVREHINVFIGDENVRYTGGLASPVAPGSEISIVPAVSGGCARLETRPAD